MVKVSALLAMGIVGLLATVVGRSPVAAAADLVWVGNDGANTSNFSNSGNWQGNTLPSWGYTNSLKFNQNQNSNVTGLNYDWGEWRLANDISWDSSFPVARTLSASNGGGINFKTRIENNSSFTQTVDMNLSGGSDGASDIQLNPVKGSLTLSGTIFNDNSVDYTVYGSDTGTTTNLTLNTALGWATPTQANVDFTVAGGRNTAVQVNASQLWAGTTTVNSGAFTTGNGVTLASTAIVVGGGTVATTSANTLADAASLTVNTGRLSIGGSDTVASLAGSGGSVDVASGATLTFGGSGSTSYAGSITGAGNLTKVGSGTFTLPSASSLTGTMTVEAGQFSLGASNLLADTSAVAVAGGVLALGLNFETVGSFAITSGSLTGTLGSLTAATYAVSGGTVAANLGTGAMTVTGNASLIGTWNGTTLNLTSGTLTLGAGGRLTATTAVAVTGSAGAELTLGGNQSIGSLVGAANVALGSYGLTVGGNNQSMTYSGDFSGSLGQLVKVGSGTLTLAGVNSNWGDTTVSGGRLVGTTSILQMPIVNDAAVTFDQATSGTYSRTMSGSGSLTKLGSGTVTLSVNNPISGGVAINAGSLAIFLPGGLGSTGTISFGGGALQYAAINTTDYSARFSTEANQQYRIDTNGRSVTLGSNLTSFGGTLTKLGSGTLTLGGSNSYGGGTTVTAGRLVGTTAGLQGAITNNAEVEFVVADSFTSYISVMSGSGSLTKSGTGILILNDFNTYSGGTIVSAGELWGTTMTVQGAIANSGLVSFQDDADGIYSGAMSGTGSVVISSGGPLTFTAANSYSGGTIVQSGGLIGTTESVQGAITNNAAVTFDQVSSGTYAGNMGGSGSLTKLGSGIVALTGVNTYAGSTLVDNGTLRVNGLPFTSDVSVTAGATLAGTGTVGGPTTIFGTHSPGNSPGVQTFSNNLTYEAGSIITWELIANTTGSAGTDYDQIVIPTANLVFSGSSTLDLSFDTPGSSVDWANAFWNVNRSWSVLDLSAGTTTSFGNLVVGGSLLDSLGNTLSPTTRGSFSVAQSGQDVVLNFTAVPEPSAGVLAVISVGLAAAVRRRRTSRAKQLAA